jgi:hypothetical protein
MTKCPLCGEAMTNESMVSTHIQKIHPQREAVPNI